jgi:hypothetical protein
LDAPALSIRLGWGFSLRLQRERRCAAELPIRVSTAWHRPDMRTPVYCMVELGLVEAHEPMSVQTLRSELALNDSINALSQQNGRNESSGAVTPNRGELENYER